MTDQCKKRRTFLTTVLGLLLLCSSMCLHAQVTVYPVQGFSFGTFIPGSSGGKVQISAQGLRTAEGDIFLVNSGTAASQAIFEIEAPEGTVISLLTEEAVLSGSNGGSMTLTIDETSPLSPFNITTVPPARTTLHLAGTLTVGDRSQSPPGDYEGTINITFNYQ